MSKPLCMKFCEAVATTEVGKSMLHSFINNYSSSKILSSVDEILDNSGKEYIDNFNPKPIDKAISLYCGMFATEKMYHEVQSHGEDVDSLLEDIQLVGDNSYVLGCYLEITMKDLIKNIVDHSKEIMETTHMNHTFDREELVCSYYIKIMKTLEIEGILKETGWIDDIYVAPEDKTLLISLLCQTLTYKDNLKHMRDPDMI